MKSRSPKVLFSAVLVALACSSCYNDENNRIEAGQDLGYITTVNNTVCAATSCGYVTSPEIKLLTQKECYFLGYIISNPANRGIFTADQVTNVSKEPLPQVSLIRGISPSEGGLSASYLNIPFFASTNYLGDRWLFTYSVSLQDSVKTNIGFYYNPDNQIDESGRNIKNENKVILDVYFSKVEQSKDTVPAKSLRHSLMANLESLRYYYAPDYSKAITDPDGYKSVNVLIQFRYSRYLSDTKKTAQAFLGSWNTYSGNRYYYMTYMQQN